MSEDTSIFFLGWFLVDNGDSGFKFLCLYECHVARDSPPPSFSCKLIGVARCFELTIFNYVIHDVKA